VNAFRDGDLLRYGPEEVARAVETVRSRTPLVPEVALILGSGLGGMADGFEDAVRVPYAEIPGFPRSTVEGHAGRLVLGRVGKTPAVAQQGRFHLYEGYSAAEVTFPLRVLHALGARILLVTNAAGGVDPRLRPGDLMVIEDQVNFQFRSPLRGRGPLVDADRFVDLGDALSPRLVDLALRVAAEQGIPRVRAGTYWGNLGPAYETPAEVQMVRTLGGDAVGMSTVPEVVVARHLQMEVLGIACISNLAAGLSPTPLTHEEVIEVTREVEGAFSGLVSALVPRLRDPAPGSDLPQ
jgi:purine-nucleoside phosphorylase